MNKTIWKLQIIGERLWILANLTAQRAATLKSEEGRGLAIVADETRNLACKLNDLVGRCLFDDGEIEAGNIRKVALQLHLLALNAAIESSRFSSWGKPVAVCADDIRNLAYEVAVLFQENTDIKRFDGITPMPKTRINSIDSVNEFLLLDIAGVHVVEPLINIKEVCMSDNRTETHFKLRGMEIPLVDGYKLLGKSNSESSYVILQTPWAERNKTYAVAADVLCIFYCRIGKPVDFSTDMPLAKYLRECWESENDEAFYFMDWTKML